MVGGRHERTSFAVLGEGLYLRCLDPCTSKPDSALDDDCSYHGEDSSGRQLGYTVVAAWQELLDRLLQNLEERYNHNDREDQNSNGFEASSADGKLLF